MLLIFVVATATVVIAVLLAANVWLVKTIRSNMRVQAQVTAEMLDTQAAGHRALLARTYKKHLKVWALVDERDKTIEDLELAVELLHLELQSKEEQETTAQHDSRKNRDRSGGH